MAVRQHETVVVDGRALIGQDIDIDHPRPPALLADPSERVLDGQARIEQAVRVDKPSAPVPAILDGVSIEITRHRGENA